MCGRSEGLAGKERFFRGAVWPEANGKSGGNRLRGLVGEILIYGRGFLVDEQIQEVKRSLRDGMLHLVMKRDDTLPPGWNGLGAAAGAGAVHEAPGPGCW
ncbi:MAG: hypothetical protein JXR77_17080 [Lentisphaeria bacterium]|nr:hypothetical protein [Lentisphaeria bacterium]